MLHLWFHVTIFNSQALDEMSIQITNDILIVRLPKQRPRRRAMALAHCVGIGMHYGTKFIYSQIRRSYDSGMPRKTLRTCVFTVLCRMARAVVRIVRITACSLSIIDGSTDLKA